MNFRSFASVGLALLSSALLSIPVGAQTDSVNMAEQASAAGTDKFVWKTAPLLLAENSVSASTQVDVQHLISQAPGDNNAATRHQEPALQGAGGDTTPHKQTI